MTNSWDGWAFSLVTVVTAMTLLFRNKGRGIRIPEYQMFRSLIINYDSCGFLSQTRKTSLLFKRGGDAKVIDDFYHEFPVLYS